jgi:hypothetical protein
MSTKHVPPSANSVSFNCPNCGALAHQSWFRLGIDPLDKDTTPHILTSGIVDNVIKDLDDDDKANAEKQLRQYTRGVPFIPNPKTTCYGINILGNAHVSRCYSCNKVAVWLYDKLAYPAEQYGPEPNDDLPGDILRDYQEASTILDLSPRGAAALLRLCIQKICIHLEEDGKDLNADIGSLVEKGLDPRVKKSLDTVRVVGNESVHPGQIDMRDDRETASKLFNFVNLIVEIMISQPKHIDTLYEEKVSEGKKEAIKKRDGASD